jgi:OmpA-OmpF porin, OOP family
MSDSIFNSLLNMLDGRTVGAIAHTLGPPENSVSRAMESSIAALLGGVASKAGDPNGIGKMLDTIPSSAGEVSWSEIADCVSDPNSSLMAGAKRALMALFGPWEKSVTSAISRESGLSPGAISTLLTMAAPVVISYLNKQVRSGEITTASIGGLLEPEIPAIRNALPFGLSEMFWPGIAAARTVSPVVAQAVQKERSLKWLAVPAIAALGLGLLWFFPQTRRPPTEQLTSPPTGAASRLEVPEAKDMACTLPTDLNIPAGGVEASLVAFLQNPEAKPVATTAFNLDKLKFDTGSAALRPESHAELATVAAILSHCPTVHVKIAGYTDNVGAAEPNFRLSRNRADNVVAQLVSIGVSPDRLTAEGYGKEFPIADNSSADGRAQNRRIAMTVTQK